MSNLEAYSEYVKGADRNDRFRFDVALAVYLAPLVDESTWTAALEAAAAEVNR